MSQRSGRTFHTFQSEKVGVNHRSTGPDTSEPVPDESSSPRSCLWHWRTAKPTVEDICSAISGVEAKHETSMRASSVTMFGRVPTNAFDFNERLNQIIIFRQGGGDVSVGPEPVREGWLWRT